MKKLLKSEICGSVNSTRVHYSRKTWSKVAATVHEQCMNSSRLLGKRVPKKKKRGKCKKLKRNVYPNRTYICRSHKIVFDERSGDI